MSKSIIIKWDPSDKPVDGYYLYINEERIEIPPDQTQYVIEDAQPCSVYVIYTSSFVTRQGGLIVEGFRNGPRVIRVPGDPAGPDGPAVCSFSFDSLEVLYDSTIELNYEIITLNGDFYLNVIATGGSEEYSYSFDQGPFQSSFQFGPVTLFQDIDVIVRDSFNNEIAETYTVVLEEEESFVATNTTGNTGTIQEYEVPYDAVYRISTKGAAGNDGQNGFRGLGAVIEGDVSLNAGEILRIVVGQIGIDNAGSGGTFVTKVVPSGQGDEMFDGVNVVPIIIAGGGSVYSQSSSVEVGGRAGETSGDGPYIDPVSGGSGGNQSSLNAGAGGGYLTNGGTPQGRGSRSEQGRSFLNGAQGGTGDGTGGFGGGASRSGSWGGGAAGGYSGGSSNAGSSGVANFGGGGSFNSGTNQTNIEDSHDGAGEVTITLVGAQS